MTEEPHVSGDQMEAAAPQQEVDSEPVAQDRSVPLDALEAERSKRQKVEEDLQMMRDHMQLLQAQQSQPREAPKDDYDGLTDDDVLTVRDLKKALSQKENQFQMTIQELRMTQKYPNYSEVVTKYLPDVLKNNPELRDTLQKSKDYELAYYLARKSDAYQKDHKKMKKNADAERIVQNAERSGSLSSVGQTSPINEAKRYKSMSDEEFKALANKNLGYF